MRVNTSQSLREFRLRDKEMPLFVNCHRKDPKANPDDLQFPIDDLDSLPNDSDQEEQEQARLVKK